MARLIPADQERVRKFARGFDPGKRLTCFTLRDEILKTGWGKRRNINSQNTGYALAGMADRGELVRLGHHGKVWEYGLPEDVPANQEPQHQFPPLDLVARDATEVPEDATYVLFHGEQVLFLDDEAFGPVHERAVRLARAVNDKVYVAKLVRLYQPSVEVSSI